MSFFRFNQNNTGGTWDFSDGLARNVFIEADHVSIANIIAQNIGIYFNGVEKGRDCPCCGNRWEWAWSDDGEDFDGVMEWLNLFSDDFSTIHFWNGDVVLIGEPND